jgi:uncharacterized Zn finger protein
MALSNSKGSSKSNQRELIAIFTAEGFYLDAVRVPGARPSDTFMSEQLLERFQADPDTALYDLGFLPALEGYSPSLAYLCDIAHSFVDSLAHDSDIEISRQAKPPSDQQLLELLHRVPFVLGLEHISVAWLRAVSNMGYGGYGYGGFAPYESVASKKARAAKRLAALRKHNPDLKPVSIEGRSIAKSWWAKAWNTNLESYADYANRIDRGKSYLKTGMVLDLVIEEGQVSALVLGSGSSTYAVHVVIDALPPARWQAITEVCGQRIDSVAQLAEGKFPKEFGEAFLDQRSGLFPSPKEIHFDCSCPDYAYMCKHVAAVLYGIGARFDEDPLLFFRLRGIAFEGLLKKTIDSKVESMLKNARNKTARVITGEDAKTIFGL